MAELKGYFFDSTEDDERLYQAADLARFMSPIIGDGFSNTTEYDDWKTTTKKDMDIEVGTGAAYYDGYMAYNESSKTLTHDTADPNNDRIDRVVIRFDNSPDVRKNSLVIKKGTPDKSPTKPGLKSTDYVEELGVANVLIKAGKSYIDDEEITD